jgi:D-alanyl-D-alanine carboxypeptidase
MKTGFICASGFNLVATATRDNKQLIAVVLGAPSSAARAVKAAELLESGFAQNPLSWLTPSLGTVDQLAAMDAPPPNLKDEMCGPHRKRPATEEDDPDAPDANAGAATADGATPQFSVLLSALRAPTPKNLSLLPDPGPVTPVVVYAGPTKTEAQIAALQAAAEAAPIKRKAKKKEAGKETAKADGKAVIAQPAADNGKTDKQAKTGKPTGSNIHYTPSSSSALAATPQPVSTTQKKPAKPAKPVAPTSQ